MHTEDDLKAFRENDRYRYDRALINIKIWFTYGSVGVLALVSLYILYRYLSNVSYEEICHILDWLKEFGTHAVIILFIEHLFKK